jgi:hypothetical protein
MHTAVFRLQPAAPQLNPGLILEYLPRLSLLEVPRGVADT